MIVKYPDLILRKTLNRVTDFNNREIKKIIADLKKVLEQEKDGVGLAASQIGYEKRIFYVSYENFKKVFINAQITNSSKEKEILEEGCLSLKDVVKKIARAKKIIVKYYDQTGKKHKQKFKGFLARIIQHEIDHLNGKLIIDYDT